MAGLSAAKQAVKRTGDVVLDRYLGVETAADVLPEDLEFSPDRADRHYQATNWLAVLWLAAMLRRMRPTRAEAFLDYGAGKGRVVLIAGRLPFGRVIGVELSPSLARIGRRNLERNRHRLASDAVLVEEDMASFVVPDDVAVVYLYNPSEGDAFLGALARIRESLERRPRRFRLIYVNVRMHEQVLAAGFRLAHDLPFVDWRIYAFGGP